jgi:hypothetical protein
LAGVTHGEIDGFYVEAAISGDCAASGMRLRQKLRRQRVKASEVFPGLLQRIKKGSSQLEDGKII